MMIINDRYKTINAATHSNIENLDKAIKTYIRGYYNIDPLCEKLDEPQKKCDGDFK